MKIILQEDVKKLGKVGRIIDVADGYARNFLLPRKKALRATPENLLFFEKKKLELEQDNQERLKIAKDLAKEIDGIIIILVRQASDNNQLYGSVSAQDIAKSLMDEGFSINRQNIILNISIKTLGSFSIPIDLHPDIRVHITLLISQSLEEGLLAKDKILKSTECKD